MLLAADGALILPLALREALIIIEHVIKTIDIGKHGVLLVPPDILAVELAVVIHFHRDHAGTVDDPFLLVHHDFNGLFPTANNPFTVLIKTH